MKPLPDIILLDQNMPIMDGRPGHFDGGTDCRVDQDQMPADNTF
jgi:hypothetical protein